MNTEKVAPQTIEVDVQYVLDGKGNSGDGRFTVSCNPGAITVTQQNSGIIFTLSALTPPGIVFAGYTHIPDDQLGAPVFTPDFRTMSLIDSDSNKKVEIISITLQFRDQSVFIFDPEVTNDPTAGPGERSHGRTSAPHASDHV